MKVVTEPSVYVLGRQQLVSLELDAFLADHGVSWESDSEIAAEVVTETAGRVCYMSFAKPRPGGNSAYLQHIKEVGHGSVLEHAVWSFLITGVSRSLTHEFVRHRAGFAYSQLSQRYVDESVAECVLPPDLYDEYQAVREFHDGCIANEWTDEAEAGRVWFDAVESAHAAYGKLVEYLSKKAERRGLEKTEARKYARQAARSVLPNATETKITVTANARALRHFLEQRGSKFAEPEIRVLANQMLNHLKIESANLFGDYTQTPLPDGTHEITTPYRKV